MALTLTKQPEAVSLSGNPVVFEITTDTTGVTSHKIHLRVTFDGELKGEDVLPVINGKAEFDISDYLKKEQNGHFCFDENFKVYDLLKLYSVEYFETYNNDGLEYGNTVATDFKVMQGKLGLYNIAGTTYYEKFYNKNNLSVMSFRQGKKYTYKHEDDFIYIFAYLYSPTLNSKIEVTYLFYLTDGTSQAKKVKNTSCSDKIIIIQTGYNNFIKGLVSGEVWENDIFKYKLIVDYLDDTPTDYNILTEEYILKEALDDFTKIVLKNRLGVYEVVNFNGISESGTEFSRQFSERNEISNILYGSSKKVLKANTGWITKEEYDNILMLLESKDSYLIKDTLNIPIIITSKKSSKKRSDNYLYSIDIEFEYANKFNF